jgi:hypothetical protein
MWPVFLMVAVALVWTNREDMKRRLRGGERSHEEGSTPALHVRTTEMADAGDFEPEQVPGPFADLSMPYRDFQTQPCVRPIRVYRTDSGEFIGSLSESELFALKLLLETQNGDDGYYIDVDTLVFLDGEGVSRHLLGMLWRHLQNGGIEIEWRADPVTGPARAANVP